MNKPTLFLDIGNSQAKLASEVNGKWNFVGFLSKKTYSELTQWLNTFNHEYSALIWTSVVSSTQQLVEQSNFGVKTELNRTNVLNSRHLYETPQTLGLDRFFACAGAFQESKQPVIVIDAGTALTIDLMDDLGVFQGGVISPGLSLWERALLDYAPALPNVSRGIPTAWPPKSTESALKWGISGGFIALINSMVGQWKDDYPNAEIWCVGGDGRWVQSHLENSQYEEFLVFKGMKVCYSALS